MNRVRQERERAGLSQQALAQRAGLSLRTIVYIESGRDVKLSTFRAVAAALDLPVSVLLVDEREAS